MASKNAPTLTGMAPIDLGLGADLHAELAQDLERRRKRKAATAAGQTTMGPNAMQMIAQTTPFGTVQ